MENRTKMTTTEISKPQVTPKRTTSYLVARALPHSVMYPPKNDDIISGWGSCRACKCRGYTKSGDGTTCGTCGHHFDRHW